MIPRYQRPAMATLWSEANVFRQKLRVEAAVALAQAELSIIPKEAATKIAQQAEAVPYDAEAIKAIEENTQHDVIALLQYFSRYLGEAAPYLHFGLTSSDVLDTSLALNLKEGCTMLLGEMQNLLQALCERAHEHKQTLCIGRSHGIHAEPTSFGLKLASHYAEFKRCYDHLLQAQQSIATCAISGAVGTYAHIDPRIEAMVAHRLALAVEPISTQIIPRDRHAHLSCAHALIASAIERIAVELRHLQRSEVAEVEEAFASKQQGSSAMPHKRNPISGENLTGLARMVRSYCIPALENVALWHERDISHSSVERVMVPDSFILLDYSLARLTKLVSNLVVNPATMEDNLNRLGGIYTSQRVLLALIEAGCTRQQAYLIVQKVAHAVIETKGNFQKQISQDSQVLHYLDKKVLLSLFNAKDHLRHVDDIFARVFPEKPLASPS